MLYGTLTTGNTVPITDPYYDRILRGQMPEGLIVPKLFAQMPSKTYKGRIPKQNTSLQVRSDLAVGKSGFPTIQLDFEAKDTYKITPRGLTVNLTYADIEELGGEASAQAKTLGQINSIVQLTREYQTAANATNTAVMTQYFNPLLRWSDPGADIQSDISAIFTGVRTGIGAGTGCGEIPNVAIIPWPVYNVLSRHPQLIKAFYFGLTSQNGEFQLSEKQMAVLFGLDEVFVPRAIYNSAAVGATKINTDVWGKNVIVAKIDRTPNPNTAQQSWGYTFNPSGPNMIPSEFSYTWQTPGVPLELGQNVTKGYSADDVIVDANAAVLVPNVIV